MVLDNVKRKPVFEDLGIQYNNKVVPSLVNRFDMLPLFIFSNGEASIATS